MRLHNATALAAIFTAALSTNAVAQSANAGADVDAGADFELNLPDSAADAADRAKDALSRAADKAGDIAEKAGDIAEKAGERAQNNTQSASERASQSDVRADRVARSEVSNYGQLISSLRADDANDQTSEIEVLTNVSSDTEVSIVLLSELRGAAAENANSLNEALAEEEERITEIRDTIADNSDLMQILEENGYTVEDVVAVEASADGDVTLVIDETS